MSGPIALVSFTIRPGSGSEAGVGWAFLLAALQREEGGVVHLILDARDEGPVRAGLAGTAGGERVVLHPVAVPAPVLRHYGDRRTRQSYLAWLPSARRELRALAATEPLDVAHQVTFASAVLPTVLARGVARRAVWGPVSVPGSASGGAGRFAPLGAGAVRIAEVVAARNIRSADLVVANNEWSRAFFARHGATTLLEPNIVAEPRPRSGPVDDRRLLLVGHLVPRKRPWLAVRAMKALGAEGFRLDVIGEGPLRVAMEELAVHEGVGDDVRFVGALPHRDVLEALSTSRLLVHPSSRESGPWVVGEAAACGLASVVMAGSGAESTVALCGNGGVVAPGDEVASLVTGVRQALERPVPEPVDRWSADRLPALLDAWYRS